MAHVPERTEDMSSYSEGQTHQLMDALEKHGFTPADITALGQFQGLGQIRALLRGKAEIKAVEASWREYKGVIRFSVTSDGTTGEGWITRLESKGFHMSNYAKSILHHTNFKPTKGVTTEVAVLKGTLFEDNNRITKNIRTEADKRKLQKPNAEVACLIREKFTDKEIEAMGLYSIVAMHEPIKDSGGDPFLLSAGRDVDGRWLVAYYDGPDHGWGREVGFAFAVSQVSS